MKKLKQSKVLLFAAAIIVVCAGVLITSVHVAFGAEENKVVAESANAQTTDAAEALDTLEANTTAATPGPQYITEEEAIEAYTAIITDVFGKTVDTVSLTATFYGDQPHAYWGIKSGVDSCYLDAISGDVIECDHFSNGYSGNSITLGESQSMDYSFVDDPDNIYIQTVKDIVNASLAGGRSIDELQIDGIQFYWDNNSEGLNPEATGTNVVDCHVCMATGLSYTISLWGSEDALQICRIFTHQSQDACRWGYYYEEDAVEYSGHA